MPCVRSFRKQRSALGIRAHSKLMLATPVYDVVESLLYYSSTGVARVLFLQLWVHHTRKSACPAEAALPHTPYFGTDLTLRRPPPPSFLHPVVACALPPRARNHYCCRSATKHPTRGYLSHFCARREESTWATTGGSTRTSGRCGRGHTAGAGPPSGW